MKRIISCLLAIILLVTISFQTSVVFAEDDPPKRSGDGPTFSVSSEKADRGENVSVTISIVNNPGVASVKLKAQFDSELTLNSITYNTELGGKSQQPEKFTSPVTLNWFNGAADTTGDMTYAVLNFTVAENAALGEHPITITYDENDVYNIAENNIDFAVVNGCVDVVISVKGIDLDHTSATVYTGDLTYTLTPIFDPSNATNKTVSWSSSNEAVATVDGGVVTLIKKGSTVITATSEDGGFEATCELTVLCSHLNYSEVSAVESTCTKQGHAAYTICDDCGEVISGSDALLPLAEHQYVENVKPGYLKSAATCISPAVYYKSCSACGKKGTDTFEHGEVNYDNHVGGTHIENQADATCKNAGYTGDTVCDSCSHVITYGTEIKKLDHTPLDPVKENETEPAPGVPGGYDLVVYCQECGEELSREHVTIYGILIGDVNADGVVNNRDAMILDRFVAGWDGYGKRIVNETAADLNRDEKINNRDAMILDRYVAGWDGYGKYIFTI